MTSATATDLSQLPLRSTQLTSLTSHLIFLFVGVAGASDLLREEFAEPLLLPGLILLVCLLITGTFGWGWVHRTGHYQGWYFIAMSLLGNSFTILATIASSGKGISGAIILLPMILHGAVLSINHRRIFILSVLGGALFSVIVTGIAIEGIFAFVAFLSGVMTFSYMGQVIVREEYAREQLARYARDVEELSIMRERNRLAREMHDNLGHYLTAIHMQSQAAQAVFNLKPQQVEAALGHIRTLASEGLREVRKSIEAVRALPLESRSLSEALDALAADSRSRGLEIQFRINGNLLPMAAEVEITLYRIMQEALTNIHKHAQARQVFITLHSAVSPAHVRLHIRDDGIGAEAIEGGFGLLGLQERVRLLRGNMHIKTLPGAGFEIEVELPL